MVLSGSHSDLSLQTRLQDVMVHEFASTGLLLHDATAIDHFVWGRDDGMAPSLIAFCLRMVYFLPRTP
jgi:hypothetical protein